MTHRSRSLFTAMTLLVALLSIGSCSSSGGGTPGGSSSSVAIQKKPQPVSNVVVLQGEQGRDLVTQCARSESAAEAFFTPDAGQVEAADKSIQAFYEGLKTKVSAYWYKDFPTFRRQYVGTVVGGRKQILLNAYHPSGLTREADQRDFGVGSRRTFTSCEEGILFFGAEYDIEGGQVTDLEFNSKLDFKFFIDVEDYVREKAGTKNTVLKNRRFEIPEEDIGDVPANHGHEIVFIYKVKGGERQKIMAYRQLSTNAFGYVPLSHSVKRFNVLGWRAIEDEKFRKGTLKPNADPELVREIFPDTPYQGDGSGYLPNFLENSKDTEKPAQDNPEYVGMTIVFNEPKIQGQYRQAMLSSYLRIHTRELKRCYSMALADVPHTSGYIEMNFVINDRGKVVKASVVETNTGSKQLTVCTEKAFARWTFPAPEEGPVTANQSMHFHTK